MTPDRRALVLYADDAVLLFLLLLSWKPISVLTISVLSKSNIAIRDEQLQSNFQDSEKIMFPEILQYWLMLEIFDRKALKVDYINISRG